MKPAPGPVRRGLWVALSTFVAIGQRARFEAWKRTVITAGLVSLAVFFLRHAGFLEVFEMRWLDLMAMVDRPALRAPVMVVAIDDRSYHDPSEFGGLSPLDPAVLERLARAVAVHRPRGVVLDVQIHPDAHETPARTAGRLALFHTLDSLANTGPTRWVLVRDLESESVVGAMPDTVARAWEWLTTDAAIAWADPGIERPAGIARGIARYHEEPGTGVSRATVLGAAVEAFSLVPQSSSPRWEKDERPLEPWRIRFTRRFADDTASISPVRLSASAVLSTPSEPGRRSLLTDKIVVVGGTYREGRDDYLTPVGSMPGVCFWGEAIASWIRQDALHEAPPTVALLIEFLIGVLTGYLLLRFGPGLGLVSSVGVVLPLMLVCSWLAFGDRRLFVNFLPAFVGVYLHYQIELHVELRHLKKALQRSLDEVAKFRSSASGPAAGSTGDRA